MLDEWGVPLAVMGLVAATLFLAAIHRRYQSHQAQVRAAVRRIENRLRLIAGALDDLNGVPLSREIRVLLRADVLAGYRRIAKLHRSYPAIRQRIAEAETALHAQGDPLSNGVGVISDEQTFRRYAKALDELISLIRHGATLQPIPGDVRKIFNRELGDRRAEVFSRFHLVEARRLEKAGEISKGRAHLTTLLQLLRTAGPMTPFVEALYQEAEQALVALGRRAFEADEAAADADSDQASAPAPLAAPLAG